MSGRCDIETLAKEVELDLRLAATAAARAASRAKKLHLTVDLSERLSDYADLLLEASAELGKRTISHSDQVHPSPETAFGVARGVLRIMKTGLSIPRPRRS